MFTVLHTESSKGWGGQENRTLQEAHGLKKFGVRVLILCQPGSLLGQKALDQGIDVRTLRMGKSYDVFAIRSIANLIKAEGITVINTHSGKDSFLAAVAGRLSEKKPVIVRTRHLALPITSKMSYRFLPHRIVTVSEYVRHYLIGKGISAEKIISVPTGIDPERFNPQKISGTLKEELGLAKEVPVVGTIAILRIKKGHHVLLESIPRILEEVPEAVFVFAGDGPQRDNISHRIRALGLTRQVFMPGMRTDIPNILKSIDIFVLPTLQEALGTSFIEAMAMEKPVIGTNVGGVSEVIKDGVNGYLVRPDDPRMLADATITMLRDPKRAAAMGVEGRKAVLENFTVTGMCEKMFSLYSSLLKDRK